MQIAGLLSRHPAVSECSLVRPPSAIHVSTVARQQQDGFGALISFELAGGEGAVRRFVDGLESFCLAAFALKVSSPTRQP